MKLQVLSTSDSHTFWWANNIIDQQTSAPYGLFRAASALSVIEGLARTEGDFVIKVENGDFIQGSPLGAYLAKQAPEMADILRKIPEEIGYDVRVLGNHEFNYGRKYLEGLLAHDETLLNANVLDAVSNQPFIGQAYRIFEKKGKKVAVIGLTTKYVPNREQPANIEGLYFDDPVKVARKLVKKLSKRVDAVVIAYHGGFSRNLSTDALLEAETGENQGNELLKIPGVSALVTGHQHRWIAGVYDGVPVSQPGYRAEAIGQLTVELDDQGEGVEAADNFSENEAVADAWDAKLPAARLVKTDDWPESARYVSELAALQVAMDEWLDEEVGRLGVDLTLADVAQARQTGHGFVDLINQVQLAATGADLAATALFNDEMPGFLKKVSRRQLLGNYPFPNTLVTIALTGAQVKEALEVNAGYFDLENGQVSVNKSYSYPKKQDYNYDLWAGLNYRFDLTKPLGQRVRVEDVAGQPFDLKRTYRVAVNNYRATGAGNPVFAKGKILERGKCPLTTLIADFLKEHEGFVPEKQGNFHLDV
ncbi:bifunctional metallophosphatase/5'-nucleotidase [Fructobacillus papyrifericola]|uniref:Bifunctional metallophosphatase/5'-nucleotidase n=1 Tax=Fructobacillus papyrifericola TaxID=2713172 RepID=A0ABS5QVV6_9LACO|nr:bifunctional UDP-sugar hydrolase/5'-nucleotidase [Fructobacillus papyrifericola]MBS9336511.1 bifunctional metallophosphatase/5'-nucleotidase [Fructobacillus papyrifericola]